MADLLKSILGDGTDDNPYHIDGIGDLHFEVISMDYGAMQATIRVNEPL